MQLKRIFYLLVVVFIASCKKDNNAPAAIVTPPQTLTETLAVDNAEIEAFLKTHFYNYEEFANPEADFDYKIKIGTIEGANADKVALYDQMQKETILVEKTEKEGEIAHTLYYLVVKEGIGENHPTIGDNSFVTYEGSLLDGTVFDSGTTPTVFNLSGVAQGFGNGVIKLKPGTGPVENGNGTVSYEDYGIGLFVMPSGLGYFNSATTLRPAYSPLVFKVNLLSFLKNTDSDGDGTPNFEEDVNGDGNLNNDDTDKDGTPDYLDADS